MYFQNYVYNALKYMKLCLYSIKTHTKKLNNTLYLKILLRSGMFVTKFYEHFNKLAGFNCKFDLV